jgi:hypothetical protein
MPFTHSPTWQIPADPLSSTPVPYPSCKFIA